MRRVAAKQVFRRWFGRRVGSFHDAPWHLARGGDGRPSQDQQSNERNLQNRYYPPRVDRTSHSFVTPAAGSIHFLVTMRWRADMTYIICADRLAAPSYRAAIGKGAVVLTPFSTTLRQTEECPQTSLLPLRDGAL